MAALKLLTNYDNMIKKKRSGVYKESEIPVTMKFMRSFRAEMLARFSAADAKLDKHIRSMEAHIAESKAQTAAIYARLDAADARSHASDAKFAAIDARFDAMDKRFDAMDARFDALEAKIDAKIDAAVAEMKSLFQQALVIFEEQNLRNKQAYDSAAVTYEALEDLKRRIKPECLDN